MSPWDNGKENGNYRDCRDYREYLGFIIVGLGSRVYVGLVYNFHSIGMIQGSCRVSVESNCIGMIYGFCRVMYSQPYTLNQKPYVEFMSSLMVYG